MVVAAADFEAVAAAAVGHRTSIVVRLFAALARCFEMQCYFGFDWF